VCQQACTSHAVFQQLRRDLTALAARCEQDTNNPALTHQFKEQEAVFQAHSLYQQGAQLALSAQSLRDKKEKKADHIIVGKHDMILGISAQKLRQKALHRQEAQAIRDELLQPVRALLKRPSTPPRSRLAGQAVQGAVENVVDTGRCLVVDLPVLAARILGGLVHSLVTWQDKLGIGDRIEDYSTLLNALFNEWQYEWENPAEYRARVEAAQAYRTQLAIAEKALNAEAYHLWTDGEGCQDL